MAHRPAAWFRNVAALGLLVAVAMVPAVTALLHGSLPLWLHIPLTGLALTLLALGSAVAGVAMVEFRQRREPAKTGE
ncbi:MAG: hypothetical protein LOD90_09575 [Symbiobacteriaceae bacterium]|nr:MAG: hypothetical protein DIU55_03305 [Bacillota bacterium]